MGVKGLNAGNSLRITSNIGRQRPILMLIKFKERETAKQNSYVGMPNLPLKLSIKQPEDALFIMITVLD